jgi:hypothetical protein
MNQFDAIKLATPEGEKVFPLATLEAKTKGLRKAQRSP